MSAPNGRFTGPFTVVLANAGNPDYAEDPEQPLYGTPGPRIEKVSSLEQASAYCRQYIARYSLGAGHWVGGELRNANTGERVGYVSYNGSVWPGHEHDWKPGVAPLYQPDGKPVKTPPTTLGEQNPLVNAEVSLARGILAALGDGDKLAYASFFSSNGNGYGYYLIDARGRVFAYGERHSHSVRSRDSMHEIAPACFTTVLQNLQIDHLALIAKSMGEHGAPIPGLFPRADLAIHAQHLELPRTVMPDLFDLFDVGARKPLPTP